MRLAKPGHWTTTVQQMKADRDNFEGRTILATVDDRGRPLPLAHTLYHMASSRPALLAKGRAKRVENEILLPADSGKLRVMADLVSSATGSSVAPRTSADRWTLMPSNQYFLLVLAREPGRYAFLKATDAVRAPYENDNGATPPHYRVVLADGNKPLPLPRNVLTWTSVAYVVWDEVNLARVDAEQQAALVDWLHWGGRLIVNGPDSLAALRGSFLDPYLPVDPGGLRTVAAAELAELNAVWTSRERGQAVAAISVTRPWSGIELKPRTQGTALPGCEGLFYEGPVGAGSVVVSGVQLAERDLVNWPGFDGFINGALLDRPRRTFSVDNDGTWTGLQSDWVDYKNKTHDAHFTTPLRWFARDAQSRANVREVAAPPPSVPQPLMGWGGTPIPQMSQVVDRPGGLGQWSEFGPVSQAAREALREAAGVRVPAAGFVVACLAVYLVVLVPLNWMAFHALGKIEWAWLAAPIIALVGTVAVVRQAQLDIGFVRAQTEIAVLELQGDHPRGHLTRYTALYSSLSTTYDLEFDDATAVAAPFPRDDTFEPAIGDTLSTVAFEKYDKPRLRGLNVQSATTQLVHGEQLYPLAGAVRLSHPSGDAKLWQLQNKSGMELSDATVLHRTVDNSGQPKFEGCWLGQIRNGASVLVPRSPVLMKKNELPYAAERAKAAQLDSHKRLNVDELLKMAFRFPGREDPRDGLREEWRLVARVDEVLPGARTSPAASQMAGTTVILAHLQLGPRTAPQPDVNSPRDVLGDSPRNKYEEYLDPAEIGGDYPLRHNDTKKRKRGKVMNQEPAPIPDAVEKVAREVIDSAFKVHQALGPGLLESVYETCLCHELTKRGVAWMRQLPVNILYDDIQIEAGLRLDLLAADSVAVELKAVEEMKPLFEAQLLTYLKLTGKRVGFLINFNSVLFKQGVKRIVL